MTQPCPTPRSAPRSHLTAHLGRTSSRRTRCWRRAVAALLLFGGAMVGGTGIVAAGEAVKVVLKSGRSFSGEVDERSNREHLVLRVGSSNIALRRSFSWLEIETMSAEGAALSVEAVRSRLPERSAGTASKTQATSFRIGPAADSRPFDRAAEVKETSRQIEPAETRLKVRSLSIDAYVANWDADVEPDGLVVHIFPLDAKGRLAPTDGTLTLEWISPVSRRSPDTVRPFHNQVEGFYPRGVPLRFPYTVERLGSWTENVNASEYSGEGYVFHAAFPAIHPEFDCNVANWGLVRARLVSPGEGVFEGAVDGVVMRNPSPVRTLLHDSSGSRYLSHELMGRR